MARQAVIQKLNRLKQQAASLAFEFECIESDLCDVEEDEAGSAMSAMGDDLRCIAEAVEQLVDDVTIEDDEEGEDE